MADRSITVRLRLLDQYSAPMKRAAASTKAAGAEISGTLESTAAIAAESGAAAGEGYAAGLNSTMATAGRGAVAEVDASLQSTTAVAGEAGAGAGRSYAAGLDSSVASAGRGAAAEVDATLQSTSATAGRAGASAGSRFTAGLDSSVTAGARGATASVDRALAESSGPAAASGRRAGTAYSTGLASGVRGGVAKANGALALLGKGGALSAVALVGVTLVKGFQRLNAIDQAKAKLTGLGNSATAVTAIMNDALASVKGTAYGMDEAATTAAGAVAAGLKPGKELQADLKLVADAASIAGTSMADMGSIFNKVATSNKLQGDDIAQISDKGIPIVALLAKTLHKSSAEVVALASAGKINFKQFSDAMQQGVGGAAQKSGETFNGAMKNLMASLGRIGANLLSGIFPKLQGYATGITNSLAGVEKGASGAGSAIGSVLGGAVTVLGTSIGVLAHAIGPIVSGFQALPGPAKELVLVLGLAAGASRVFGSRVSSIGGTLRTAGSGIAGYGRNVRAMGQIAREAAPQMGRLNASVAALSTGNGNIARMASSFGAAASGASRFPRAAGAAAAAMTGIKGAAGGLVNFLGGPFGLALIGAGVGLMLWQKHQADAAQKVAEHRARVDELTESLKKDGNELGKTTAASISKNLVDSNTIDTAKQMGISQTDLTKAWLGQPDALKKVNGQLDAYDKKALQSRDSQGRLTKGAGEQREAVDKVRGAMNEQVKDTGDMIAKNKEYAASQKIAGDALKKSASGSGEYVAAQKRVAAAEAEAAKGAKAMKAAVDSLNNTFLELRGGERGYEAAIDDATAALKKNGQTLDKTTEKGRANAEALDNVASSAQSMLKDMTDNGASAHAYLKTYDQQHAELVKLAKGYGMSASAAEKYANKALLVPKEVKSQFTVEIKTAKAKLDAARAAVKDLGGDFDKLPKNVQMKLVATGGKDAKAAVDGLTTSTKRLPGDARVGVSAPGALKAAGLVDKLSVAAVTADGKIVSIPCSTPGQAKALHDLLDIKGAAVTADGKSVSIPVAAPLSKKVAGELNSLAGVAVSTDRKSVSINSNAPGAAEAARLIRDAGAAADRVNGKVAHVKIVTDFIKNHIDNFEKHNKGFFANGGVVGSNGVRKMASGGVSRPAMIASKPILWAEAGPEAYLPLGANKRNARTEGILRMSADILGFDVIKRATGAIDGVRSDWARAMPVAQSSSQKVTVTTQLDAADRALLQQVATQSQVPFDVTIMTPDRRVLAHEVSMGQRQTVRGLK